MRTVAPNVIEQGISELREAGELDETRWELFSDIERGGWSFQTGLKEGREEGRAEGREEGRAEGREEGRAEGRRVLRRAVTDILELRGFVLTPLQRERIESCESVETLERWYAAAKTAAADHDVDRLLD